MSRHDFGLLGAAFVMASLSTLGSKKPRLRTDADRLREIDRAQALHEHKLAAPAFIAAARKRERKRLKHLSLTA